MYKICELAPVPVVEMLAPESVNVANDVPVEVACKFQLFTVSDVVDPDVDMAEITLLPFPYVKNDGVLCIVILTKKGFNAVFNEITAVDTPEDDQLPAFEFANETGTSVKLVDGNV